MFDYLDFASLLFLSASAKCWCLRGLICFDNFSNVIWKDIFLTVEKVSMTRGQCFISH